MHSSGWRRFQSLRTKPLLVMLILLALTQGAAFGLAYTLSINAMLRSATADISNVLTGALTNVDGHELAGLIKDGRANANGFSDDPRFQRQLKWLEQVHAINPKVWPTLIAWDAQTSQFLYAVDLWQKYDPDRAKKFRQPVLDEAVKAGAVVSGRSNLVIHTQDIVVDHWGSWLHAHTSIRDSDGQIAGVLVIAYRVDSMIEMRDTLSRGFMLSALLGLGLMLLAWQVYIRLCAAPIKTNITPAQTNTQHSLTNPLQIEVNELQRKKEVRAIVGTEFFSDLQAKAERIRKKPDKRH